MNLVFGWCVAHIEPEKREQWEIMLSDPLPGQEKAPPTPFQAEDEAADFMSTLAMHQARGAGRG
jgi:hypothetical protein